MSRGDGLDRLRSALEGHGSRITGSNAQCPGHDDRQASLSIGQGDAGAVLRCHAGCATDEILEALGLSAADLFDEPRQRGERPPDAGPAWTVVATYPYTDEAGEVIFYVERREPKDFRQYRLGPDGGKVWKLGGTRRVLYHLPALIAGVEAGRRVWIVEGEKDVHALEAAGEVATTVPGGAGKWRSTYAATLAGAKVAIVADRDKRGRKHAAEVRAGLTRVASSVTVVEAAAGKDAADHLAAGLGVDEFTHAELPEREASPGDGETESSFADRLIAARGDAMRYVGTWGWWLTWDGKRWARDTTGRVHRWAEEVVREVTDATDVRDDAALKRARGREKAIFYRAMVQIASHRPKVAITHHELDAHWHLLNAANGTLDLRDMTLRDHDPGDMLTKVTRAAYHPEAVSELWDGFLEVVQPKPDIRGYVARLTGLGLEGRVAEHLLAVHYGAGSNGKTTAFEAISWALGDYAAHADPELLIARRFEAHPTGVAALYGLRLALLPETDAGASLAEGTVKRLTGGDQITARRMREDFWSFEPSHSFHMMTNHRPEVKGTDRGIWRRLKLVPWDVEVAAEDQDANLGDKLRGEGDAILAWLTAGYSEWREDGLAEPADVTEATSGWREESDLVAQFVDERCLVAPAYHERAGELWSAWARWCEGRNADRGTQARFNAALERAGFRQTRGAAGLRWRGITLQGATAPEPHEPREREPLPPPPETSPDEDEPF